MQGLELQLLFANQWLTECTVLIQADRWRMGDENSKTRHNYCADNHESLSIDIIKGSWCFYPNVPPCNGASRIRLYANKTR
jgi:hypothetical protein